MSRIDQINEKMLAEFAEYGIEDTIDNRRQFLLGLKQAWNEDPTRSFEKSLWLLALTLEITTLTFKIARTQIK